MKKQLSLAVLMSNIKGYRHCLMVGIDNMLANILANTAFVEVARWPQLKMLSRRIPKLTKRLIQNFSFFSFFFISTTAENSRIKG